MVTLDQIAQLGAVEKDAAREFADRPRGPWQPTADKRMSFLAGVAWERERGDLEALGALRAVLQGMPGTWASPAYAATLDKARALLASRIKA
jgi:hypothetical protein